MRDGCLYSFDGDDAPREFLLILDEARAKGTVVPASPQHGPVWLVRVLAGCLKLLMKIQERQKVWITSEISRKPETGCLSLE